MTQIYSEHYDDVYFSAADGLREKRHVFLDGNDLPARWQDRQDFVIAELGFGTGLSCLAAAQAFLATTKDHQRLHILSIEGHPISADQMKQALQRWWTELQPLADDLHAHWPRPIPGDHRIVLAGGRVSLTLFVGDVGDVLPQIDVPVDAWFLDGFTPAKNPAMWSEDVFKQVARLSATGATAATYSAARVVKDGLAEAGFDVHKADGFGYKSDMVRAVFLGAGRPPLATRRSQRVAVVGGGVAGTAAAHALALQGHQVTLCAPYGIADAGSGNPRGLYNPRFGRGFGPVQRFYASGFAHLLRFVANAGAAASDLIAWKPTGTLHLVRDDETRARLQALIDDWGWGPDDARMIDAEDASARGGLPLDKSALWLPHAGSIVPVGTCQALAGLTSPRVDLTLADIQAKAESYDAIILACAGAVRDWPGLADLPVRTVRGQISLMRPSAVSAGIKTNLCYGGYIIPQVDGVHVLGSTFQHWLTETTLRDEDHVYVRDKLHDQVGPVFTPDDVVGGRASLRLAARDHVPVIGRLNKGDGASPDSSPPVYLSVAHGSHGLVSGPLAGLMLADMIGGAPLPVVQSVARAVSPARFSC